MTVKLFLHGVPDSPAIWRPLLEQLKLPEDQIYTPTLPGFDDSLPTGFAATKEAYVEWFLGEMERLYRQHGAIDAVGHDWGALIVQRAAMVRPDLFRSWVISNAVIEPEYRGHRLAQIWSMPILGEIFMSLARPGKLAANLLDGGVPADIAYEEAAQWAMADKRRAILTLYRSAKGLRFDDQWIADIPKLPKNGALIWGEDDPYVGLDVAQRFIRLADFPLFQIPGAGHWAIAQRPAEFAAHLKSFWQLI